MVHYFVRGAEIDVASLAMDLAAPLANSGNVNAVLAPPSSPVKTCTPAETSNTLANAARRLTSDMQADTDGFGLLPAVVANRKAGGFVCK